MKSAFRKAETGKKQKPLKKRKPLKKAQDGVINPKEQTGGSIGYH